MVRILVNLCIIVVVGGLEVDTMKSKVESSDDTVIGVLV